MFVSSKENNNLYSYDPRAHPGLSMVRTVMYIFILFVVFWNVNATSHVLSIPEIDFEDEVSLPLAIGAPAREHRSAV